LPEAVWFESGGDHFVLRYWLCVKESLHRRLAEAPPPLMRTLLIVFSNPFIESRPGTPRVCGRFSAGRLPVELVERRLVEALDDAVCLQTLAFRLWSMFSTAR
jgi:hypothetical protein